MVRLLVGRLIAERGGDRQSDCHHDYEAPPRSAKFSSGGLAPVDDLGHPQFLFRLEPDTIGHPALLPQSKRHFRWLRR
jgi:hypothetical protein